VFEAPIKSDFVAQCLANPHQFLIVACDGDKVVGKAQSYVFFFPEKPAETYIEEIDVAKKYRRKGIATGLMDAVGREAKKRGCTEYWLVTEKNNKGAQALYERTSKHTEKSIWYEFYC
jgi:ribosomal protein S18 acetylase RimI-like enzyme